jgi:hypothetical protein
MKNIKKGQSVDFRNTGVPAYILEMRETAKTLALEISASEVACSSEHEFSSSRKKSITKRFNRTSKQS